MRYTGSRFPERLDDPSWRRFMPDSMAREIRSSLEHIPRLPYYADFPARIPTLPEKFDQLREAGVTMMIGTDAGIPSMFHGDATWREMERWERLGVPPMRIIQAATLRPARFLGVQDSLGALAPGKIADVIAVRGDPLRDMRAMREVEVVVKDGRRVH
jgi:imidazolonepropionase-like amidohydrolase